MVREDIIAASASPMAACGRIVLRISGAGCWGLVAKMDAGALSGRGAVRVTVEVEGLRFPALLLLFEQGHSYTGEESAEMHLPGDPLLARMTLQQLYALGARPADAGEFTARAFFNERLDLTEAEGVAATIAATNQRELDAARRLGAGELAKRLRPIMDSLAHTLALLEAGIDFSEEDIRFIPAEQVQQSAADTRRELLSLLSSSRRFERLTHEPLVVLCGRPNAGKSTLLNALAGRQRAVVSAMAGTTRDLLSAEVQLERGMVRMVDTAGLESGATKDGISRQMQERASRAIQIADVLVLVCEAGDAPVSLPREPSIVVTSKSDLHPDKSGMRVSAITGEGLQELREELDQQAFGAAGGETVALNARHVRQIQAAADELGRLLEIGVQNDELMAEHLRAAADALGEITGIVSTEDLLGRIFSSFCIGK